MKKLIILLAVLFMFMSVSVLTFAGGNKSTESVGDNIGGDTGGSEEGDKEEEEMYQDGYVAVNSNHIQELGGKSENAFKGLENADTHSKAVEKSNSGSKSFKANSKPKHNNNGGSNKGVKNNGSNKGGKENNRNKSKENNGNKNKGKK